MLCVSTIVGCSGGKGGTLGGAANNGSHNKTNYVNDSNSKSADKMAFGCEDIVITIDSKDIFTAHFAYKNNKNTYEAVRFNIYNTEDVNIAKEKLEKLKNIVNVYIVENDYVNVKDVDGNNVSLAEYYFIQDILVDIMIEECSMYLADAKTVKALKPADKIRIEILDENVEEVYYDMEFTTSNFNADMKADAEFKLNGKQVMVYEGRERVFVQLEEGKFLMFEYSIKDDSNLEDGKFKDLFIKHFK